MIDGWITVLRPGADPDPLVELVENRDYNGSSHLFFDVGNQTLLGFFDFPKLGLEPGVEAIGGVQHIAISVAPEQWNEIRAKLDEAGVPYVGPDIGIPESMYLRDPDGIGLEMLSDPLPPDPKMPRPRLGARRQAAVKPRGGLPKGVRRGKRR